MPWNLCLEQILFIFLFSLLCICLEAECVLHILRNRIGWEKLTRKKTTLLLQSVRVAFGRIDLVLWLGVLFSYNTDQKWFVPTIFLSFWAQSCVCGRAWDSFQAVWLIKHLQKIRARCRIVLLKMKPIGTRRKQLYKTRISGLKLKQVCSML